MPIKLNLLAEAQAAEDVRRKDPVKRAIAVGALIILAMLVWSGLLYWETAAARAEQARFESTWIDLEKRYTELAQEQKLTRDLNGRIAALERYSTNRFLWGSTLNAVQQTIPQQLIGTIQLMRLNGMHTYQVVEAIPVKKKGTKVIQAARAATSTERIAIILEARDYGNPADQNFNKFKNAILGVPYFKNLLSADRILIRSVGQPLKDVAANKDYAPFTLECQLPPSTRNE
ncbi:MAG: hypothetical protein H0X66_17205 [Verrucomicrobia bacterium]|nr:hypothetical protein [Verrucomicrobiota bacterium]